MTFLSARILSKYTFGTFKIAMIMSINKWFLKSELHSVFSISSGASTTKITMSVIMNKVPVIKNFF